MIKRAKIRKQKLQPAGLLAALIVIGIVAAFGIHAIFFSHAATSPAATIEAENGTVAGTTASITDSSASGSRALRFGTAKTATTLKLMPLGDSITYGVNYSSEGFTGGYRTPLWQQLVQTDGDKIDFVGSNSDGPSNLGDKDNEGHPGWCMDASCPGYDDMTAHIDSWLSTYKPDIILLHGGTNDLNVGGYNGAQTATHLDTLLGKIFADLPNTHVVVAKIISIHQEPAQDNEPAYISAIPGVVSKYQSQGRNIQTVDMSNLLNWSSDFSDNFHPNIQGYNKMANAWYPVVKALYQSIELGS